DYVLISMPYSTTLENETITVTIPLLYDNGFNVIWNSSAGDDIAKINANDTLEDYRDYLDTDYEAYLNGTGVDCSASDSTLSSGLCYKNTANKTIWMKIPHFSGVGPEIANGTTPDEEETPPSSSGGGSSTPAVTYDEQTVGTLAAGSSKTVTFTKSSTLAVTEITVIIKNKVTNAKIKVDVGSLPSGASVPSSAKGSVYKYITITKTAMTDSDVSKGIIKFKVRKEWLKDKGYGRDTIVLHRYYNNNWNKLETTRYSEDATYYYYSAESPGFSTFAITAEEALVVTPSAEEQEEAPEEEAEENVTTEEPQEEAEEITLEEETETKSNTVLIVALIAVIIILGLVGYFVKQKKQKKKGEYKKKKKR
ncbi:MAG TPA: PGF-pre-PGF domain-containing protein, partial [Candidatus Woesearchaeota archaeon]|nr:PGF-pre-PGF domain-containing protein [Candidatus Woesearchaeota archaeon]